MVTQKGLELFCRRGGLLHEKHLKVSDIRIIYEAAKYAENPEHKLKNICRFMFFEAVTRIGLRRFYNDGKGECNTQLDAIK